MRSLLADTIETGAWRLLWIPPSLPYYSPGGSFADPKASKFTKRLVFSAWRVAPKAIASMLSYEAERRMVSSFEQSPENSAEARKRRRALLRFDRSGERLTGMPVLGLLYPSPTLSRAADPLAFAGQAAVQYGESSKTIPSMVDVLARVENKIRQLLNELGVESKASGPEDESWYWAAPILLDLHFDASATREWFSRGDLDSIWAGEDITQEDDGEESLWTEHVNHAWELIEGRLSLGCQPADLPKVLAQLAVAGPGVSVLRSILRETGVMEESSEDMMAVRDQAAQVAWGFRSLFNIPEAMSLLRGINRQEPYGRRVLEYCVEGCLQSVLDEYVHILVGSIDPQDKQPENVAAEISESMSQALNLRTVALGVDELVVKESGESFSIEPRRMRVRFALRFGDEKAEDDKGVTRSTQVREAFNSPFRPFVIATTSIGQEGLDFHPYCHAVVHWDLPTNPVDLEQREGRVHRYKGHAVRKNLASRYGVAALANGMVGDGEDTMIRSNPWEYMFAAGKQDRTVGTSDLVPFWIYPVEGGAKIERHVPALPLSRDLDRLAALRRSLAVYRIVFGQPRQEDLLEYLLARLPEPDVARLLGELQIDLRPPMPL